MLAGTPFFLFSQPSTALSDSCMISFAASVSRSTSSVGSVFTLTASRLEVLSGILHLFRVIRGITNSFFFGFLTDLKKQQKKQLS